MLQKDNRYRLLSVFFDDPLPDWAGFQLRELGRKIRLAPKSVKIYLDELVREGLVLRNRLHGYPVYSANRDDGNFRFLKKLNSLMMLNESGLIDYLYDSCTPDVIVLFGSVSRGEDIRGSDVDLFLQCKGRKLNLASYEKRLGRKLNLLFAPDFRKLSAELKNNMINGTVLKGYLSVF